MKINPMCDLLVENRPENDSDTQYYECEDCYRYEICKNYGCMEMCSLKEIKEATPNILEPSYDLLKKEGYFEMSMISEQVKYLREFDCFGTVKQAMLEAADTIEVLSTKLQAANMERSAEDCGGWIACKDRTPDKQGLYIIHVITGMGEDYVGTWIYQQGVHLSGRQTYIDDKQGYWASPYSGDPVNEYLTQNVIAWQPMPEPYRP